MAVKSHAVTVSDEPTRLDTSPTDHKFGSSIAVFNGGATTLHLGGDDVSAANGAPVPAGTWSPGIDLQHGEHLFGFAAADVAVRVLEQGV